MVLRAAQAAEALVLAAALAVLPPVGRAARAAAVHRLRQITAAEAAAALAVLEETAPRSIAALVALALPRQSLGHLSLGRSEEMAGRNRPRRPPLPQQTRATAVEARTLLSVDMPQPPAALAS
jgi:hypothetical protein